MRLTLVRELLSLWLLILLMLTSQVVMACDSSNSGDTDPR
jgi:hypothetical protein